MNEGGFLRGWTLDLREAGIAVGFDALRLLAAALVVTGQAWPLTGRGPEPWVGPFDTISGIGVALFFVVSGFLGASSLERSATTGSFFARRALRFFPGYALACVATVAVLGPLATTLAPAAYAVHPATRAYLLNLTLAFVQPALPGVFGANPVPHLVNGALWTLPIGAALTVLLGLAGTLAPRRWTMLVLAALALGVLHLEGTRWAATGARLWVTLPLYLTAKCGAFYLLGAAAWAWRDRIRFAPLAGLALAAGAWFAAVTPWGLVAYVVALAYGTLCIAALPLRVSAAAGRSGELAFGVYLYAWPVQQALVLWAGAAGWPLAADIAACFGVALLLAGLSWRLVERPALAFKPGTPLR